MRKGEDRLQFTQIVLLLLIGVSGYGLGRKIWRLLRVEFNSLLEDIVFSLALGWGALAYLVLGLGVGRLLYRGVAYGLVGLLALISLPELRAFLRTMRERRTSSPADALSSGRIPHGVNPAEGENKTVSSQVLAFVLWALLAVTLTVALIGALTPPLNYDALSYHLGFPKEFIRYHKIVYLPHQVYSNLPCTLEMLYRLSLLLTKEAILAKLVHLSFGS